jgi:hypothetical protein
MYVQAGKNPLQKAGYLSREIRIEHENIMPHFIDIYMDASLHPMAGKSSQSIPVPVSSQF